ncbi:3-dehydroquinate dehydratase [Candidatus Sulfurimonas marisnigri]|uniref:3-dehydroquinate dehydratase n=1 Tax=Candidatus Sulfurimonas marisnigri TaxID=2740405 RepID=A0A7S7LZX9_9BACT|nr:3-dehydroquinate dehydratase [Candidatus Sulfurimonas marisnigri]QOY54496.1 3-dehydroquinate dehydratase [Candidatus Sulfurimonas marisnigri]
MKFSRGLAALILTLLFNTSLTAQYLYKDEVIFNPAFGEQIEKLGYELHQKTGISLRLIMLKELPNKMRIVDYEKELMKDFSEPTVLLTFSEMDSKVDILASEPSLYKYFDKKQILSPISSPVQAFVIALMNMDFSDMTSGGTILPLLAQKAKQGEVLGKYSGSMFNGYADIAEQIAESKNVVLQNAVGNANQNSILLVKVLFYGIIVYGIVLYIKRKLYFIRKKNELS